MTIDIDAIRARADAATPGPWVSDQSEIYSQFQGGPWVGETLDIDSPGKTEANAEFIAHAREDIPALLAEVTELRAEMDYERRSRFAYEERVADQVENLRTENERLRAQLAAANQTTAETLVPAGGVL